MSGTTRPFRLAGACALLALSACGAALAEPADAGAAVAARAPRIAARAPRIAALDAPSNLGLRPPRPGQEPGVRRLPEALRGAGLLTALHARDAGRVAPPPYSPDPDRAIGFRNGAALRDYSLTLADRLRPLLRDGEFALVLGGDCSVLLGSGLALKQRGRYGLAFVDAHDDFSFVRDRKRYAGYLTAAGLDLGLATGHGPAALSDLRGQSPYFRTGDVVHLGLVVSDEDKRGYEFESFERSGIHSIDAAAIRRDGARAAGRAARARLEAMPTEGFWIHVDADVLAERIMPAVDSPNPDGLEFAELRALLAQLLASPKAVGLELTIFDPDLDPDGSLARELSAALAGAFADSGRWPSPRGKR
ncbi:arginase family protein [Lysobacter sp. K5869]|uniref:arginase family protein n=1 Tax=Lysobacter sp. K5869 TaxID=2820808 RepID=UPI001C062CBE|nr:arginase family protein [Lysobacter sp. K5869]QWP78224.1 arginase family protein [Lysobacter sp. K5869]